MESKIDKTFLLTITLMSALGLISSDIYLPALTEVVDFFSIKEHQAQSTLSIYLLGLGLCQLVYGPLSDLIGRKPAVLVGMVIFCVGSIICALSTDFSLLLFGRLLQGMGACSGLVLGRTMIADRYNGKQVSKILTTIFPIIGASPALAPLLGSQILTFWSWKDIFIVLAILGLVIFILVSCCIEESLDRSKLQTQDSHQSFTRTAVAIATNSKFIYYTVFVCVAYSAYFSYLAELPFILDSVGINSKDAGKYFLNLSIFYIIGNLTARKLLNSCSVDRAIAVGAVIFLVGVVSIFFSTKMTSDNILSVLVPISFVVFGNGFLLPLGVAKAIESVPSSKGTASGIMGALQLSSGALAAYLVGLETSHSMVEFGNRLALTIIPISLAFLWKSQFKISGRRQSHSL